MTYVGKVGELVLPRTSCFVYISAVTFNLTAYKKNILQCKINTNLIFHVQFQ